MTIAQQAGERRGFRLLLGAAALVALGAALWQVEFRPDLLLTGKAWRNAGAFLATAWPPKHEPAFLLATLGGAVDTLCVAALGTALALLIGAPLATIASRTVTAGGDGRGGAASAAATWIARAIAAVLRSIPEVIWACVLVRVVGLGPTAGVIALGLAYGGMIAKVYAEQLDALDPAPARALAAGGSGRVATFAWAQGPQVFPACCGYAMYRFECAVRASAIIGYVGGGGLGFQIEHSFGYGSYDEVATQVLVLVAIVAAVEAASDVLRRKVS